MAAFPVSVPVVGHRLRGAVRSAFRVVKEAAARVVTPHRAALRNLASIPLTVAGVGCICAAIFLASTIAGLIALGITLIALEHVIADED